MSVVNCDWIEEHLDEYLAGGCTTEERNAAELHLAACADCRESARIWSFLSDEVPRAEMRPIEPEVEGRLLSGEEPDLPRETGSSSRRVALWAVPAAAAALVALALWISGPGEGEPGATASADAPAGPARAREVAPHATNVEPVEVETFADGRRGIPVLPGTTLWLDEDAEVVVDQLDEKGALFRLTRGFVVAEIGPVESGFRFVVTTPDREVEARGTVFSVRVAPTGGTRVRVAEGVVEVRPRERAGAERLLTAGQEIDAGGLAPEEAAREDCDGDLAFARGIADEAPRPAAAVAAAPRRSRRDASVEAPDDGPAQLLKLAQGFRRSRSYNAAAATYEQLVEEFPGSREAAIALVALGQLRLKALRQPAAALALFDEYLERAPSGDLSAAALCGRVRALSSSGRHAGVVAGVERYLGDHPTGPAAPEMRRRRGEARAALGDCPGALRDFGFVIERWPESAEAERCRVGLDACAKSP